MWGTSLLAVALSVIIWGQGLDWNFSRLTAYRWFPLFGLTAFGLMWSHYITAALRLWSDLDKSVTKDFFDSTSMIVLVLILMHPGLLIFQLWSDGFGLPPNSYFENYVAPSLKWTAFLGTLSLIVFLAYELRHWFQSKPWWKYLQYASDAAMLAIVVHGFRLGTHLQTGWFRAVWVLYALTLVASMVVIHLNKLNNKGESL